MSPFWAWVLLCSLNSTDLCLAFYYSLLEGWRAFENKLAYETLQTKPSHPLLSLAISVVDEQEVKSGLHNGLFCHFRIKVLVLMGSWSLDWIKLLKGIFSAKTLTRTIISKKSGPLSFCLKKIIWLKSICFILLCRFVKCYCTLLLLCYI